MSVVYFGTGAFAVPALRAVAGHVSLVVVSQPAKPTGRGLKVQPSPVELAARELGIPHEGPAKARDKDFVARIEAMGPTLLLVASYGQILSGRLLRAASGGGINLHGSVLPKYRGAAPIQRAILEGEDETGITLMRMDEGMDTGPMIAVERTPDRPRRDVRRTPGAPRDRRRRDGARVDAAPAVGRLRGEPPARRARRSRRRPRARRGSSRSGLRRASSTTASAPSPPRRGPI